MAVAVAAQPLPPLPMAVLARRQPCGLREETLGFQPEDCEVAWRGSRERLARLAPDARFVAARSTNYIQLLQPELVIAAVQAVDDAVRDPASWDNPAVAIPEG